MRVIGVASNGGEALAIAAADRPDVALVDVDLGVESGLDVARALATCDEPVSVILISAYAEKDLRDLLDDSPAVGFLPKSVLSRKAIEGLLERDPCPGTRRLVWVALLAVIVGVAGCGGAKHGSRAPSRGGSINVAIVGNPNMKDSRSSRRRSSRARATSR